MKYIFVTGSGVSGLGKGLCASTIGILLKACNLNVTAIKMDPYFNMDASLLAPNQHGETFVLEDGSELDLDFGNYERNLDIRLTKDHSITAGKIYWQVIAAERRGDYLSQTVQTVPHITNAVQEAIIKAAHIPVDPKKPHCVPDVTIVEIGGTTNDIENQVFYQAFSQFRYSVGADNCCHVHLSLVLSVAQELKSKPTQHGVASLRSLGVPPDVLFCRSPKELNREVVSKISSFCYVPSSHVISFHDVKSLYEIPILFSSQHVPSLILNCLKLNRMPPESSSLECWADLSHFFLDEAKSETPVTNIGIVGKYIKATDAYLSITKALEHASFHLKQPIQIVWIDSETLQDSFLEDHNLHGLIVPGGFGSRGVEGKIKAIQIAKERKIPLLGICLGFQLMVIAEARGSVKGYEQATSEEFALEDPELKYNEFAVISMAELNHKEMGGTMRLGLHKTKLTHDSLVHQLYDKASFIEERHRHRYEINPKMQTLLQQNSKLIFSGIDQNEKRLECAELPVAEHPFFVGVQFHPEFSSRPFRPAPLFTGLLKAIRNSS